MVKTHLIPMKIILTLLLLFLTGCATTHVDVDYDPTIQFKHLSRYSWLQAPSQTSGDQLLDSNTLLHDNLKKQIELGFKIRGYLQSEREAADFLVIYRIIVEDRSKTSVLHSSYHFPMHWHYGVGGYYSSFAWHYYPQTYTYEYQQGTLVIDIINPDNQKLMWRGMAHKNYRPNATQLEKQSLFSQAIHTIMKQFPPEREPIQP